MLLLLESANNDVDNEENSMDSWGYILNNFYNKQLLNGLIYARNFPILGSFAKQILFEQISHVNEVTSTYITAHERVEHFAHELPIPENVMHHIIMESRDLRMKAEEYISNFINNSFPEIT